MPKQLANDSVGLIVEKKHHFKQTLTLVCGKQLTEYDLVYETYGQLNAEASNAVLICHALSGDHHAAGYHSMDDKKPGWWENCIGPGKPIDTNLFYVVSSNTLGHCKGSTGPNSINPDNGQFYGPDFPMVTVKDWVNSQVALSDALGIKQWAAIIGGSLGGMQVLQWAIDYPNRLRHAVVIAAAAKLSAQNIAFNEVARQAILSDPDFHQGHYYQHNVVPKRGLMLARMLGHITYLSDDIMGVKFGRELRQEQLHYSYEVDFQIESYLRYQGKSFVNRFDANSYLLMTKALDYFDPANDYNDDLTTALSQAQADFFLLSFTSDWRFSPQRSREILQALINSNKNVDYVEIESEQGHDAFLLAIPSYLQAFHAYMKKVAKKIGML